MLRDEELDRIAVVLVRARNPNNIGAVARAMHDFGFSDLRIVNEFAMPLEGARSAVDASAVIEAARSYGSLAEAVSDCTVVVGTTAVGERDLEHRLLSLDDAFPLLGATVGEQAGRVGLIFGSEKTGLSNEELSHCNWLLTIPMAGQADGRHLSMNLGQAVAVCLYELVRGAPLARAEGAREAATAGEMERLTGLLAEVLETSEYGRHHPANSDLEDIRRLVLRMGVSRTDTPVWMGILRQVLWKLRC
jgi:TrmH family RNA methyltransferase